MRSTNACLCILLFTAALAHSQVFSLHPRQLPVGPRPSAIVAADLNDDGFPEILTADTGELTQLDSECPANDELSYWVADGDLEYTKYPALKTGFAPYCITVANVDALKAPDLVVASFLAVRGHDVSLFRNIRKNEYESLRFAVPDEALTYSRMRDGDGNPVFTTPGLTSLIVRDMNGDGYRDVVATGWSSDVLVYFAGAADSYFGDPVFVPAPGGPRDVVAADFDEDGVPDLAATMYSSAEIALWRGLKEGGFKHVDRFRSWGRLPHRIRVADINQDERPDLVVSHCHMDDSLAIFYGEGGFRFGVSQEILLGAERQALEYDVRDIVVADLDGDGDQDIAVACAASRQVVVLRKDAGEGLFRQVFEREEYDFEEGQPHALCVTDLDQDGAKDLAVALWQSHSVAFLLGVPPKAED